MEHQAAPAAALRQTSNTRCKSSLPRAQNSAVQGTLLAFQGSVTRRASCYWCCRRGAARAGARRRRRPAARASRRAQRAPRPRTLPGPPRRARPAPSLRMQQEKGLGFLGVCMPPRAAAAPRASSSCAARSPAPDIAWPSASRAACALSARATTRRIRVIDIGFAMTLFCHWTKNCRRCCAASGRLAKSRLATIC